MRRQKLSCGVYERTWGGKLTRDKKKSPKETAEEEFNRIIKGERKYKKV